MSDAGEKIVAIVGGGISGLSAAESVKRHARAAGVDVKTIVFEASDQVGGKITTEARDGFVIESGPHGFLDKEPTAMALIERLGLNDQLVKANEASANRYVLRKGQLRLLPGSPPAFLKSDILPFFGKMRVGFEPFIPQKTNGAEETVWQFASRRIGRQAADVLVDAMVTGIYGGDPKRLSVSAAFPRLIEIEREYGSLIKGQIRIARQKRLESGVEQKGMGGPTGTLHSFKDGLGVLIHRLAEGTDVELNQTVSKIEKTEAGYRVSTDAQSIDADCVILSGPTFSTSALLRSQLEKPAEVLSEVLYAPVSVVVQAFDKDALGHALQGFGFLVPGGESREILGSIWASSVFDGHAPDGRVMLRTLLGGARRPELAEGDDETLGARALGELVRTMGIRSDASPLLTKVFRWPRGIPQYELGHAARVAAADAIEAELPGVFVSGNGVRGVAMIQCVKEAERTGPLVRDHLLGGS